MAKIALLDRETCEKIAAGEVIERPASVIKELVENSIDAGSTQIYVDIAEGGLRQITVSDNGCGMTEEELDLAVLRFATSKIRAFSDLEEISTLGFRGEALPSIGAISRLEILSCLRGGESGHRIVIEGGEVRERAEAAADRGTLIRVSNLFFNTPARKKFQKSASSETARISHYLSSVAVMHRHIHFRLRSNSKVLFNYPPELSRKDCLMSLWTLPGEGDLLPFSAQADGIEIEGFAGSPFMARNTRTEIITYVNGRPVSNPLIYQAIQEGYQPYLPPRRFPCLFLSMRIDGHEIDVNVHPAKTEIRFLRTGAVFRIIRTALAGTVCSFQPDISGALSGILPAFSREPSPGPSWRQHVFTDDQVMDRPIEYNRETGEVYADSGNPPSLQSHGLMQRESRPDALRLDDSSFVPLTQLYDTYIAGRKDGELWLLDQHAAHERIVYERLQARSESCNLSTQGLLFPEVVELPPAEAELMGEMQQYCRMLGVEIEHFGGTSFMIRSMPSFMKGSDAIGLIRQVLSDLMDEQQLAGDRKMERLIKSMACRGSIQAGQRLTASEMETLVRDLLQAGDPLHCPHGRPTFVRFGRSDLEKIFKRK